MAVDKHPNYWAIWAWLAIITLAEIYYAKITALPESVILIGLLVMAVWKAVMVALYFMHVKFEGIRMKLVVLAPLPLTIPIVLAVITEYIW